LLEYSSFAMPIPALDGAFDREVRIHERVRPHFWYFTFAACGVTVQQPISYEIHAENVRQGWQREFGVDERGAVPLHALATPLFFWAGLSSQRAAGRAGASEAKRARPLLRILLLSALLSAVGSLCLVLHYWAFAVDGRGVAILRVLGQLSVCAAKALLSLLTLLIAKGWSLFQVRGSVAHGRLMLMILLVIILMSVACEIHADFVLDWSTTLYLYDSWPGTVILGLHLVVLLEVWRSMHRTCEQEKSSEVRAFYRVVAVASLLYFLTLPAICAWATLLRPWVRAKYVGRGEVAARFLATLMLLLCLQPARLDAVAGGKPSERVPALSVERCGEDTDGDVE